jgi:hypothetical protein
MQVDVTAASMEVEWLYAGMLPFVRWEGEGATTVVDTLTAENGTIVTLSDYAGQAGTRVDLPLTRRMGLTGTTPEADFTYGHEAGALPVVGNPLGALDTFVLPNVDGASEGGAADWSAKAYVSADVGGGLTFQGGDSVQFFNRHVLSVAK